VTPQLQLLLLLLPLLLRLLYLPPLLLLRPPAHSRSLPLRYNGRNGSRKLNNQAAYMAPLHDSASVWIARPTAGGVPRLLAEASGTPVPSGTPIVLAHALTGMPLYCGASGGVARECRPPAPLTLSASLSPSLPQAASPSTPT